MSAYGAYENYKGSKGAAKAQAAQAAQQAAIAREQAVVVGEQQKVADIQYQQTLDQLQTQRQVIGKQSDIESVRQQAMNLDATRQRRTAIRDMLVARSMATAGAANKGVALTDTAFRGGRAAVETRGFGNVLGINQAQYAGTSLFGLNRDITNLQLSAQERNIGFLGQGYEAEKRVRESQARVFSLGGQAADYGAKAAMAQSSAATGQALANVGNMFLKNTDIFERTGTFLGGGSNFNAYSGYNTTGLSGY